MVFNVNSNIMLMYSLCKHNEIIEMGQEKSCWLIRKWTRQSYCKRLFEKQSRSPLFIYKNVLHGENISHL